MSLINWFSNKPSDTSPLASAPPLSKLEVPAASNALESATGRKQERVRRREELYDVVRDAMTRAGVLAASYKFKVLSLDPLGGQYLIMMDLANQAAGDTGRLAEIEALIAQNAKSRYDILVTAVYWRVNETVSTGLATQRPTTQGHGQGHTPVPPAQAVSPAQRQQNSDERRARLAQALRTGDKQAQDISADEASSPLGNTQYGGLN